MRTIIKKFMELIVSIVAYIKAKVTPQPKVVVDVPKVEAKVEPKVVVAPQPRVVITPKAVVVPKVTVVVPKVEVKVAPKVATKVVPKVEPKKPVHKNQTPKKK